MLSEATIRELRDRLARFDPLKDYFYQRTSEKRRQIGSAVRKRRAQALNAMFEPGRDVWLDSDALSQVRSSLYAYFDLCDWSFLDMIALAAATPSSPIAVATAVVPSAIAYHALRMLDDILDGHHDYKGGAPTLLGELSRSDALRGGAVAANLIPAMLAMLRAGRQLRAEDRALLEGTLLGMLHEAFSDNNSSVQTCLRIAERKMGCYGLLLYRPALRLCDAETRQVRMAESSR